MSSNSIVLLRSYFISYSRSKKRILSDILLAFSTWALFAFIPLIGEYSDELGQLIGFVAIPFGSLVTVIFTITDVVEEKKSGVKEFFKLTGVSFLSYQSYIMMTIALKTAIFTLPIIGIATNESAYTAQEFLVFYLLSILGIMAYVLISSLFFSNPRNAVVVSGIIYLTYAAFQAQFQFQQGNNIQVNDSGFLFWICICLSPLTFGAGQIASNGTDFSIYQHSYMKSFFTIIPPFFILLCILVFYILIEKVNEHKNSVISFFTCCNCIMRKKKPEVLSESLIEDLEFRGLDHDNKIHKLSSAEYEELVDGDKGLKRVVEVKNLSKSYNKKAVVDNVSFPLFQRQIFCLLGQNGAGKTTLINMILGLISIDQGEVLYEERSLSDLQETVRTKVGVCSEHGIFFEKHTVWEHLETIAKLKSIPDNKVKEAAEEALMKLELMNEKNKFVEQLSGGSRRKLSIAMAILGQTKLLFLDEPTSGLDPQNRRVIWRLLSQLRDQGLTIFLTTHHLDEADELSDRIGIMSKGKLLVFGTSDYLKKIFCEGHYYLDLTPNYEKMDLNYFNSLQNTFNTIISDIFPKIKINKTSPDNHLRYFLPDLQKEKISELFAELEQIEGININLGTNTLEDVFMSDILLKKQLSNQEIDQINLKDLSDIAEEPFEKKPSYSLKHQIIALIQRKMSLLSKSWLNVFFLFLPSMILLMLASTSKIFNADDPLKNSLFTSVALFLINSLSSFGCCLSHVYEREEKLKDLMYTMGLRGTTYWIANVILDSITVSISNFIGLLFFNLYLYNNDFISWNLLDIFLGFVLATVPHWITLVVFGYAWSFLFDKTSSAIKYFLPLNFFLFFIANWLSQSQLSISQIIENILANLIHPSTFSDLYYPYFYRSDFPKIVSINRNFIECGYALFYFAVIWFLEVISQRLYSKEKVGKKIFQENAEIPINNAIGDENRMIKPDGPIRALNLRKRYENDDTDVINNVTFGIENSQVFSLLGPNGAGKSTLFNIFSAFVPKSEGSAQLLGKEVKKDLPEVFENVGVCPQFDILWDDLTVMDHLKIFGALKGLEKASLQKAADYYLDALSLREHQNKKAHQLSKGNRRKLSVANAFIGRPLLIFLDEPSTGLDPFARIFFRKSIQQLLKMRPETSIMLNTHSIHEAEYLSDKIGFIVEGKFAQICSFQDLKNRYNEGYNVIVFLNPERSVDDIDSRMREVFPNIIRNEILNISIKKRLYYILKANELKFSEVSDKLTEILKSGFVTNFSISNTSLEQIHMNLTNQDLNVLL